MISISRAFFPRIARFSTSTIHAPKIIELVAQLRKETQAPLSKCREVLLSNNLDYSKSIKAIQEVMRNAGSKRLLNLENSALKASLIFAQCSKHEISILELASETDFASNNSQFHELGKEIIGESNQSKISDFLATASAKLGEKIAILESFKLPFSKLQFNLGIYAHNSPKTTSLHPQESTENVLVGSKICIVGFEEEVEAFKGNPTLSTRIAQHAMAMNPARLKK